MEKKEERESVKILYKWCRENEICPVLFLGPLSADGICFTTGFFTPKEKLKAEAICSARDDILEEKVCKIVDEDVPLGHQFEIDVWNKAKTYDDDDVDKDFWCQQDSGRCYCDFPSPQGTLQIVAALKTVPDHYYKKLLLQLFQNLSERRLIGTSLSWSLLSEISFQDEELEEWAHQQSQLRKVFPTIVLWQLKIHVNALMNSSHYYVHDAKDFEA
jgi:hypothetical protein